MFISIALLKIMQANKMLIICGLLVDMKYTKNMER